MSRYKKYDKSFKKQAVELALSSDQSIAKTAKDLGILETTLYSWVSNAKTNDNLEPTQDIDVNKLHDELLKLRKENQRLKDTCDILKKATAYFANDTKKDTHS
jgi:transposase